MMYIITNTKERWEIEGTMHAYVLHINFYDKFKYFQKSIESVIEGIKDGNELFVNSPTKDELDICKQFIIELFR